MKKICGKCNKEKEEKDFNWKCKEKNKRQSYCKECNKIYLKDHYHKNKDYYRERQIRSREKIKNWIQDYKSTLKCEKCGEDHLACIEFHHRNPSKKETNVSEVANKIWSIERILKEIKKCNILCSNCHRKLHYEEKRGMAE